MADLGYLALAMLVLGLGLVAAILAWLTRRHVHLEVLRSHHEVGSAVFLQLGVVFAVLLAFVFNDVWSEYNSAATAMDRECSALSGVLMLSASLPPELRDRMKTLVRSYTEDVITKEFPAMRQRHRSETSDDAFRALWHGAARLPMERAQDGAVHASILSLIAIAHQNRDLRLLEMRRDVPVLIWLLLSSFVIVLIGFLLFFGVEYVLSQMVFTGAFAACLAFVLIMVHMLDYPFEGVMRLQPTDFQETLHKIALMPDGG